MTTLVGVEESKEKNRKIFYTLCNKGLLKPGLQAPYLRGVCDAYM